MNIFKFVILGLVQGFTEFLPVSSSGHLVLCAKILNINDNLLFTNVMLHIGTLLSVIVFYSSDLWNLRKKKNHHIIYKLIIACIPAVVVMLIFKDDIEKLFTGEFLCFGFLITAIVLFVTEIVGKKIKRNKEVTYFTALGMGIAQSIAVIPAISRSGSTICGGVLLNARKDEVAKFSFFMSIPIILGSALVEITSVDLYKVDYFGTAVGMIFSFLAGYFSIKVMLRLISKCNFKWFSLYLMILSIITFIDTFVYSIF